MKKSQIGLAMGVIIAVADLYWTYTSYPDSLWLTVYFCRRFGVDSDRLWFDEGIQQINSIGKESFNQ